MKEFMMRNRGGAVIAVAGLALALCGCAAETIVSGQLPIRADQVSVVYPRSVSWLNRQELLITRHQWDTFPLSDGEFTVQALRGVRPLSLSMVVGAEGIGIAYDWVLLRATPPLGSLLQHVPIDRDYVPSKDDIVIVVSRNLVPNEGPTGARFRFALGRIESYEIPPETGERSPSGTVIRVAFSQGQIYPGCSGSPAAVWNAEDETWSFLGIAAAGSERLVGRDSAGADGRVGTIVRPPSWVFDLLTPDEPKVTWPDETP